MVIAVAAVCLAVYGHATLRAMRATPVTFDRRPDDRIVVRVADKPVLVMAHSSTEPVTLTEPVAEDEYVGGWYLWPANADGTIDRTSSYPPERVDAGDPEADDPLAIWGARNAVRGSARARANGAPPRDSQLGPRLYRAVTS